MCNEVDAAPTATELPRRRIAVIFGAISLAVLPAVLDGTVVATALPSIVGDLGGVDQISWVVTAYLLTQTIATPLFGKFGDLYGRRRLFEIAIAAFTVASVLAGFSQSMLQLIGARALQGFAAGGLIVLCQAMIADVVSPRERGRWQGFFGVVFGVASVAGPLVGRLPRPITCRGGGSSSSTCPLGVLGVRGVACGTPREPAPGGGAHRLGRYLAPVGRRSHVSCSVRPGRGSSSTWASPVIIGLAVATVVLGVVFVMVERRASSRRCRSRCSAAARSCSPPRSSSSWAR